MSAESTLDKAMIMSLIRPEITNAAASNEESPTDTAHSGTGPVSQRRRYKSRTLVCAGWVWPAAKLGAASQQQRVVALDGVWQRVCSHPLQWIDTEVV